MSIIHLFNSPADMPEPLETPDPAMASFGARPGAVASAWNNARAIAGVVVLEIYRRKDFYVLFFLTALITLLMGSVNFFNQDKIVRYLKEICLFLIWISSLVIATSKSCGVDPGRVRR